jgi:hypothetical protein
MSILKRLYVQGILRKKVEKVNVGGWRQIVKELYRSNKVWDVI